jgi:aspartyl-tRNA(Asn)/glutamyl-tRNA(Gln) amidotransferase subunit A
MQPLLEDVVPLLRSGEVSSRQLVLDALARADLQDGQLGVYLERYDEDALATADRADAELRSGIDRGPLHGLPVGVKDMIATREGATTAQSLVHDRTWWRGRDAPVIERLRAGGAVIIGKTTTMEFAFGFPDPSKPFPIPRHPWDLTRWPGGSSSGSAVGIAADLFPLAVGTDTAGSIRLPAAFCGISGFKPTYGRVPTQGCIPLARTSDHIGPMARSASACEAMFRVMIGDDLTSAPLDEETTLEGVRVGIVRAGHFVGDEDPSTIGAFDAACEVLASLGASILETELPLYAELTSAVLVSTVSEAYAYHHPNLKARWHDYFASTREMLAWGALLDPSDYVNAQRVRRAGRRALRDLFEGVDIVISPTATIEAPTYEAIEGGLLTITARAHTLYWNATGNPVLALPIGTGKDGLPLGAQVAGPPQADRDVLRVGRLFQAATNWHRLSTAAKDQGS